jgi:hypothetical protein
MSTHVQVVANVCEAPDMQPFFEFTNDTPGSTDRQPLIDSDAIDEEDTCFTIYDIHDFVHLYK